MPVQELARSHCGKIRVSQGKHMGEKVRKVKVVKGGHGTENPGSSVCVLKSVRVMPGISGKVTVSQELKWLKNQGRE